MPTPKFSSTHQPTRATPPEFRPCRFSVAFSEELATDLHELSRHVRRHRTELVRAAVQQYVDYYRINPDECPRN